MMNKMFRQWLFFGLIIFVVVFSLLAVGGYTANFGRSVEGESTVVTFSHSSALDSARAYFAYPDSGNFYANVKLLPLRGAGGDSLTVATMPGTLLDLDSIGTHLVRIDYWPKGADSTTFKSTGGIWLHSGVDPALWAGYGAGNYSETHYNANVDTIFIFQAAGDTVVALIFNHSGGSPGDAPNDVQTKIY